MTGTLPAFLASLPQLLLSSQTEGGPLCTSAHAVPSAWTALPSSAPRNPTSVPSHNLAHKSPSRGRPSQVLLCPPPGRGHAPALVHPKPTINATVGGLNTS